MVVISKPVLLYKLKSTQALLWHIIWPQKHTDSHYNTLKENVQVSKCFSWQFCSLEPILGALRNIIKLN